MYFNVLVQVHKPEISLIVDKEHIRPIPAANHAAAAS